MGLLSRQPARVRAMKSRLYDLIDRATSEYLSAPNFALNTDVISSINAAPDPAYAAGKACKRFKLRLGQKNPRVQQLTLQLLENCVRSCGERFHTELAKSELFPELLRLADRSSWASAQVQAQVLALLQEWAYMLRPAQFANAYSKLKAKGLPFPPHQPGTPGAAAGAPEAGAQGFEPYPGLSPGPLPPPDAEPAPGPGGGYGSFPQPYPRPQGAAGGGLPHSQSLPHDLLSPQQPPEQIRSGLEVARNTLSLFDDMLDGVAEEPDGGAVRQEYITDMVQQVTAMKSRLTSLIERVSDESILVSALELNDSTQRSLDRYADMVSAADGRRQRPPPRPKPAKVGAAAGTNGAGPVTEAGQEAVPAGQQPAKKDPMLDLLSLDDWHPAPAEVNGSSSITVAGLPQGGLEFTVPPPARPPPTVPELAAGNNPFAQGAPAPSYSPPQPAVAAPPPALEPPESDGRAPLPAASGAAAAGAGTAAANPFLSDAAFGGAIQPAVPPAPLGAPPLEQIPSVASSSGNPFASGPPAAGPVRTPSFPSEQLAVPRQLSSQASFGAVHPAFSSSVSFPVPGQQPSGPLPAATATPVAPAPAYAPLPPSPPGAYAPPVSPGFGAGGPAPAYMRPLSDAFTDLSLAALSPKRDEPPPPPRGMPMRLASSSSWGAAPTEPAPAQEAPVPAPLPAAPAPASSPKPATPAPALSAFDAFDQLASSRTP